MSNSSKTLCCLASLTVIAACTTEEQPPAPLDQAMTTYHTFDCGDAGPVRMRFVGPETIELVVNDGALILTQERSASGAKYVGDDAVFWNKGEEAMLDVGDARYTCARLDTDS